MSVSHQDGPLDLLEMKRNAASAALDFVDPGAVIGVGSGSTVWCFIDVLAESGIHVAGGVAASLATAQRLRDIGVDVRDEAAASLYVDGADEIDMSGRAIKGGGAAHTREKAIATACDYWVCIVDATKVVRALGGVPVPLEVAEGTDTAVISAVEELGGWATVRTGVLTDAGNVVVDALGLPLGDPLAMEDALDAIPGVLGNGIFARRRADVILVGQSGGGVGRIVPHRAGESEP